MADNRVLIDTDDIRRIARFTKGGLAELSTIKLDVVKAGSVLSADPVTSTAYYSALAALDGIGTAVKGDHDALVNEVIAVEIEEGIDPGSVPIPKPADPTPAPESVGMFGKFDFIAFLPILLSDTPGTPPPTPAPWDGVWVSPGGQVSPQASVSAGFGEEWTAHTKGDGYDLYAGAKVGGNVGASASGYDNAGGIGGQAEAHARLGASVEAGGSVGNADLGASGKASASASLDAQAHASGSIGKDGAKAEVGASASARAEAKAEGEVHAGPGSVGGSVQAEADASAHAGAKGQAGPSGVSGSYDVGADAKATAAAEGHGQGAGVSSSYGVEAGVGVGVSAGGGASFTTSDIGFDFNANLGLGLDIGIKFGIHINLSDIADGIGDLFTHPADTLDRWFGGSDSPPPAPPPTPPDAGFNPNVGPNGEYIGQFANTPPPTPPPAPSPVQPLPAGLHDIGPGLDQVASAAGPGTDHASAASHALSGSDAAVSSAPGHHAVGHDAVIDGSPQPVADPGQAKHERLIDDPLGPLGDPID